MSNRDKNNYIFLNRTGRWPGFESSGLELDPDGTLRLLPVPLFTGSVPDEVRNASAPDGPSGLAVDRLGAIYFSDPSHNRISRIDNCDGSSGVVPCIGGSGKRPSQFLAPCGLLVPHGRDALFVADSGNHRIQVFDLRTFQLIEIWGQDYPGGTPRPGSNPGEFNTPWTLASDRDGNVYVVDYGNQRVQKFNPIGEVEPSFWRKASSRSKNPIDIAVGEYNGDVRIFVLDQSPSKQTVYIFHADGSPVLDAQGHVLSIVEPELHYGMGMAASGNNFYLGDNDPDRRHIRTYHMGDKIEFAGDAIGYDGPVAALLLNGKGGLLVHPGGGRATDTSVGQRRMQVRRCSLEHYPDPGAGPEGGLAPATIGDSASGSECPP